MKKRVRETRTYLQVATAEQFTQAVEQITGRVVRAFASASDHNTVFEIFDFEPARQSP